MEQTERAGQVELRIHVVVDLRVHLPAVGLERRLREEVAALPIDVVGGNVTGDFLGDRIHPCRRNDVEALRIRRGVAQRVVRVAWKHLELRPPGAVRVSGQRIVNRRIRDSESRLAASRASVSSPSVSTARWSLVPS